MASQVIASGATSKSSSREYKRLTLAAAHYVMITSPPVEAYNAAATVATSSDAG
jgi:hypothetical protein